MDATIQPNVCKVGQTTSGPIGWRLSAKDAMGRYSLMRNRKWQNRWACWRSRIVCGLIPGTHRDCRGEVQPIPHNCSLTSHWCSATHSSNYAQCTHVHNNNKFKRGGIAEKRMWKQQFGISRVNTPVLDCREQRRHIEGCTRPSQELSNLS